MCEQIPKSHLLVLSRVYFTQQNKLNEQRGKPNFLMQLLFRRGIVMITSEAKLTLIYLIFVNFKPMYIY